MKNTIFTVFFSLASMGCAFYAMVYPAWFQQHYKRDGNDVFQGYGIFAFYSTASLDSPFYASETVLQYRDFCKDNATIPNYMLADGDQFTTVLCGRGMLSVQATTCTGAAVSVVSLLLAIAAVYNPSAGWGERVVSFCTLVGSLLLAVSLVIWGWLIQQRLYQVDSINSAYTSCKADKTKWSCWFYGYSFWVCLASVIVLSITGYLSSAGRAEKIRYFRKEYERDLAVALQQSMQPDGHQNANTAFTRSDTGNNLAPQHPQQPPYNQGYPPDQQQQQYGGYPPQQQPYQSYPAQTAKPQGYPAQQPYNVPLSAPSSTHSQELDQQQHQAAYPTHSAERKNHTLLGRQPSGGVV